MRQRSIHSIAHWTIMTLLLLFPVLMVGVSSFAQDSQEVTVTETYEYQTNDVNGIADLHIGNIYHVVTWSDDINQSLFIESVEFQYVLNFEIDFAEWSGASLVGTYTQRNFVGNILYANDTDFGLELYSYGYGTYNYFSYEIYPESPSYQVLTSFDLVLTQDNFNMNPLVFSPNDINAMQDDVKYFFSASDYLGEKTTDVQITNANYKQDINNWCNEFINLPVNGWYQSLMNVMGIGLTNNSVMNVIYVMPLYIIWVFILDLVVDIILVIVRLPHKALNKLGGENE